MKYIVTILFILFSTITSAESPKSLSLINFELGSTPEKAEQLLKEKYPDCTIVKYYYKDLKGELTNYIGEMSIDALQEKTCQATPGLEVKDNVKIQFVHPTIDEKQPIYAIGLFRGYYPSSVSLRKYTFDEVKTSLFSKYGKPSAEKIENTLDMMTEFDAKGRPLKGQDHRKTINYFWGNEVKNVDPSCFDGECGRYYLKVELRIEKPKKARKGDVFLADAGHFDLVDDELNDKQISWVVDQENERAEKNLSF